MPHGVKIQSKYFWFRRGKDGFTKFMSNLDEARCKHLKTHKICIFEESKCKHFFDSKNNLEITAE